MTGARDALRPGDLLAVRTSGLPAELIRIGEEMSGKVGLENHIALFHHRDGQVPWGLEGRPGGVGWADLRAYLASPYSLNNCLQPGRDDAGRAQVTAEAERMLGSAYDWQAVADDTLRAFRMPGLFASTWHGTVPGHVICSSYTSFLYGRQGWERPQVPDRDTEPGDWAALITERRWSATISLLQHVTEESGGAPWSRSPTSSSGNCRTRSSGATRCSPACARRRASTRLRRGGCPVRRRGTSRPRE